MSFQTTAGRRSPWSPEGLPHLKFTQFCKTIRGQRRVWFVNTPPVRSTSSASGHTTLHWAVQRPLSTSTRLPSVGATWRRSQKRFFGGLLALQDPTRWPCGLPQGELMGSRKQATQHTVHPADGVPARLGQQVSQQPSAVSMQSSGIPPFHTQRGALTPSFKTSVAPAMPLQKRE